MQGERINPNSILYDMTHAGIWPGILDAELAYWPTTHPESRRLQPQAKKVKTRIIRNDKLMVVEPEEVCDGDEVLGEEIEYVLHPGWDYEVEAEEDYETAYGELPEGSYGLPGGGESYVATPAVAGYLEAGEAS